MRDKSKVHFFVVQMTTEEEITPEEAKAWTDARLNGGDAGYYVQVLPQEDIELAVKTLQEMDLDSETEKIKH